MWASILPPFRRSAPSCAAVLMIATIVSAQPCALLMSGFTGDGFIADLSHVYVTLLEDGYTEQNIFVLYLYGRKPGPRRRAGKRRGHELLQIGHRCRLRFDSRPHR